MFILPKPCRGVQSCAARMWSKMPARFMPPDLARGHDSEVSLFYDHVTLFSSKNEYAFSNEKRPISDFT